MKPSPNTPSGLQSFLFAQVMLKGSRTACKHGQESCGQASVEEAEYKDLDPSSHWNLFLVWLLKVLAEGLVHSLSPFCSRPRGLACSNERPVGDIELPWRSDGRLQVNTQSSGRHPAVPQHPRKSPSPAVGWRGERKALLAVSRSWGVTHSQPFPAQPHWAGAAEADLQPCCAFLHQPPVPSMSCLASSTVHRLPKHRAQELLRAVV